MSSINTNLSAMTALQSLKSTQSSLNKTQGQISTGLRVGQASDNASYWSIATQMKSDNGALGAVRDSIKQSVAMINTFTSAMDKTLTYLNKMKEGLVAASQPGADLAKINTEFKAHIEGMKSAATSAQFNGQNWLVTTGAAAGDVTAAKDVSLVSSYDGTTNTVGKLTLEGDNMELLKKLDAGTFENGGILNQGTTSGTKYKDSVINLDLENATFTGGTAAAKATDIETMLKTVDAAITAVTKGSAQLGANKALLETQQEFIGALSDNLTAGVSAFVDADMNEASTRLQALQTQQQLGVQALSIANQNSQMILKLFQ